MVKYCQAQPQLQAKLSLKAELALISLNPATHPPPTPHPYQESFFQHVSVTVDKVCQQELEDDLYFLVNGRRPQFCLRIEDYLIFFSKMEDNLNVKVKVKF